MNICECLVNRTNEYLANNIKLATANRSRISIRPAKVFDQDRSTL